MGQIATPDELKMIAADAEIAEMTAAMAKKRQAAEHLEQMKLAFQTREVGPQALERINAAVRAAAAQGLHEIQVLKFEAAFCNDRGRRINNMEKDWPDSLEGFGKTAYQYYQKELEPLGYTLRAEIVSYPDGMLGDVGMFLRW